MQIILYIFASIGVLTTGFVSMILFLIITNNDKNPSEMTEEEFQKWHDNFRCGRVEKRDTTL